MMMERHAMSDYRAQRPATQAPVVEVRATFPSDAAVRDAVSRLTAAGFGRERMILPDPDAANGAASPDATRENPKTETDERQLRTLHSSTAAAAAAMAGAAAVVATGGAAAAAVAAAAGAGLVAGGGMFAATNTYDALEGENRDHAAAAGALTLAVSTTGPDEQTMAETAMRRAGADHVVSVPRDGAFIVGRTAAL
jgi:hypothetical protein